MKQSTKDELAAWSFVITLTISVMVGCYYWMSASCNNRWADSGLDHKWGVTTLCLIKIGDRWVPEKNYSCSKDGCHEQVQ